MRVHEGQASEQMIAAPGSRKLFDINVLGCSDKDIFDGAFPRQENADLASRFMADLGHLGHQFPRHPQIGGNFSSEQTRQCLEMAGLEAFGISVYQGNGKSPSRMSMRFRPMK